MRTIVTKLYQFEELSEEAQEKAIQECIDINLYAQWWDDVYEDAKNVGLNITGFGLERNLHATGEFITSAMECAQKIKAGHGDMCETYKTASKFIEEWNNTDEDDRDDLEDEFLKDILEDYSIMLQKEHEYKYSDEAIKEAILANEIEFLGDGTKY